MACFAAGHVLLSGQLSAFSRTMTGPRCCCTLQPAVLSSPGLLAQWIASAQVDSADQLTHDMALDAENLKAEANLDVFKPDPDYVTHEKEYEARVSGLFQRSQCHDSTGRGMKSLSGWQSADASSYESSA